ncbi:phosphoethanolamine transferase [Vibrio sp. SCSIO 43137]|uniref:phosphoethanolamine transferase n=1 Tax=Vibrio sp. SCSIO 43137 TaxID=3021011 RepID=UPI00230773FA|nr:phosphoethanolamine--lipid A transferase [Vibrio sp. SCSIO 43137]WCE30566.1 phosphoethanolamine--lipid A transferase [Vibrio sp. SCSIO 43137]
MEKLLSLSKFRFNISASAFIILMAIYFGFVLNFPVTEKIITLFAETGNGYFAYSSPLLLSAAFAVIFSLFTWPFIAKPFYIFLVFTSAMACFATLRYGVIFDYSMIENIFETHTGEALSYVNPSSIGFSLAFGVVPAILIALVRFEKKTPLKIRILKRFAVVLGALGVIAVIYVTSYKDYASVGRNNSYLNQLIVPSHLFNAVKYLDRTYLTEPLEYKVIGEDAAPVAAANGKPSLIVLVVGETARSANIGYNGYQRNTNPYTEGKGIISFQDVSSCGTATAHSLPCMFSNLNRKGYNKQRANHQDNALDIIQRAGTKVLWKENDGGDKAVAKKLNLLTITPEAFPEFCDGIYCFDEVMLKNFDQQIAANQGDNQLFAFHIIGSHGPTYWKRYPQDKEQFTPSCNQSDIENCSDREIVNVYDNTIVYTDFVLAQTIEKLESYRENYNVALMYISDHGESLGENGLYLHGTPYALAPEGQTKVPWFLWMDNGFENAYGIDRSCIQEKATSASYSHDNLFHSLIDFASVSTKAINKEMSIFTGCRK